jgi:APA family basic amino acid/polyamine antiporter
VAELRRDLGLWAATSIVIGTVIGSGIFLVPKTMVLRVGSPEMVLAVFVFGGLLSLAGSLTYAELASMMPEAGGEYVYLREAYGPFWGFIYGWTQMWVAKSGSIATLATGFFYYLANFSPQLESVLARVPMPVGPPLEIRSGQLLAMGVIAVLAFLNYLGVRVGGGLQVAVTGVKVVLIAGIVIIGLSFRGGNWGNLSTTAASGGGFAGFFAALVAALWAYDGWNNVNMVSSEVKQPQRNLPFALIFGTSVVMLIYILANLAYFYVLPAAEVGRSDRVAAEMMRRVLGDPGAAAVSVAAMISILAALNGSILSGARVPYAMARDGLFFPAVAGVHPRFFTPGNAILMLSAWSMLLVLSGQYDQLYTYVIFANWILYAMVTASVIVLRRRRPEWPRPYKAFGYPLVPVLFVLVAGCLVFATLRDSPRESLLGLLFIFVGLPFYFHWKRRLKPEGGDPGVSPR